MASGNRLPFTFTSPWYTPTTIRSVVVAPKDSVCSHFARASLLLNSQIARSLLALRALHLFRTLSSYTVAPKDSVSSQFARNLLALPFHLARTSDSLPLPHALRLPKLFLHLETRLSSPAPVTNFPINSRLFCTSSSTYTPDGHCLVSHSPLSRKFSRG